MTHIPGHTIHSWGGVSPSKDTLEAIIKAVRVNKSAAQRWRLARVLIIDEGAYSILPCQFSYQWILVSMVDSVLFNRLSEIGKHLRGRRNKPFGGIQVRTLNRLNEYGQKLNLH